MDNVYKLSGLLARAPKTIEIIPGDGLEWLESFPDNEHAPFLFVEENLGVPEKILYKCYMLSVKAFAESKERIQTPEGRKAVFALTSVILLANPAHQTALNIRKTLLFATGDAEVEHAYHEELVFTAALMSVKHCAKVSALWHHRRVLLCRLFPREGNVHPAGTTCLTDDDFQNSTHIPAAFLQTELDLAARACEIYPRNYYAWFHRTLCMKACASLLKLFGPCDIKPDSIPDSIQALHSLLNAELAAAKRWVEQHVSDYSAVDYLCKTVEALEYLHPGESADTTCTSDECRRHALELVKSFPTHETLWLYLRRTSVHRPTRTVRDDEASQTRITREAQKIVKSVLQTARTKCESSSGADPESHTIIRHALRLLLWRVQPVCRFFTLSGLFATECLTKESDEFKEDDFVVHTCAHFTTTKARSRVESLRHISSIA
ncbi:hypothetical protein M0805_009092 [Coniferiporia weirii]|nr:hypothetical protein M0805_009092 [Coniferiporia weirii]